MSAPLRRVRADGFTLRPAEAADAEAYWRRNFAEPDAEVLRLTGTPASALSRERVLAFFHASIADSSRRFFLVENPDGKIVGESLLLETDFAAGTAHFRVALFRESDCGRGVGAWAARETLAYAFSELRLRRVELEVFSFNLRARRLCARLGFRASAAAPDGLVSMSLRLEDFVPA